MANALSDGAGEFDAFLETVNLDSLVTDPTELVDLPRDQLYTTEFSNSYHLPLAPQPQGIYGHPSETDSAMELYYPINMEAPPIDPNWRPSSQGIVLEPMAGYPILSDMAEQANLPVQGYSDPCPIVDPVSSEIARSNSSSYPISTSQESRDPFTSFLDDQDSMVATGYPRSDFQYSTQFPMNVRTGFLVPMHTSVYEPRGTFDTPITASSTSAFANVPANITQGSLIQSHTHQLPIWSSPTPLGPPDGCEALTHLGSNSASACPTMNNTITQTRHQSRSPNSTHGKSQTPTRKRKSRHVAEQQLSVECRQLSKQTGVPEGSLKVIDFICGNRRPSRKRPRTEEQKKNKKVVENTGGACLLCRLMKKKCSGERPCGRCVTFWARTEESRILGKELCVPTLKLSDICPFKDGYTRIQGSYLGPGFQVLKDRFLRFSCDICQLLDVVEPRRLRRFIEIGDYSDWPMLFYAYSQSIPRWKTVILRLMPNFREELGVLESCHQLLIRQQLARLDSLDYEKDGSGALFSTILFYEDVVHLKELNTVDLSAVEALVNILEGRLRLLLTRRIDLNLAPEEMFRRSRDVFVQTLFLNYIPTGSSCLLPRYRMDSRCIGIFMRPSHTFDAGHNELQNPGAIPNCCCWVSFPEGLLSLFNHTYETFFCCLHNSTHKIESDWLHAALSIILPEGFSSDGDVRPIFRQTVSCAVMACFRFLDSEASDDSNLAGPSPDLMLIHILMLSVRIFRDFLTWCEKIYSSVNDLKTLDRLDFSPIIQLFVEGRQYYREAILEAGYFSPGRDVSMDKLY